MTMDNREEESVPELQAVAIPRLRHHALYTAQTTPQSVIAAHELTSPADYNGVPGTYAVTAILAIPGKQIAVDTLHVNDVADAGDSLILLPNGQRHRFDVVTEIGPIAVRFLQGDGGQLSQVELTLMARDFVHAQATAHTVIMAILSWLSYRYDVGIEVTAWHTFEAQTEAMRVTFGVIGSRRTLDQGFNLIVKSEYRLPLSTYREGLNNSNVFFQVLSYYKVIEWVKARRTARTDEPRILPGERIPQDIGALGELAPEEREEFSKLLGRDFQSVYHRYEMTLRNAISHLNPKKVSLEADNAEDYRRCLRAVPVIRFVSRQMLLNELRRDEAYEKEDIQ